MMMFGLILLIVVMHCLMNFSSFSFKSSKYVRFSLLQCGISSEGLMIRILGSLKLPFILRCEMFLLQTTPQKYLHSVSFLKRIFLIFTYSLMFIGSS